MYQLGEFYSQLAKVGHFWQKCTGGGFCQFLAGTFWPFLGENVLAGGLLF